LIDELVETFPAATGRDIKGLAKLVAKYCHHKKVPPELDVFRRCAIFRGIDLGDHGPPQATPNIARIETSSELPLHRGRPDQSPRCWS
jgi:hypothetical protein